VLVAGAFRTAYAHSQSPQTSTRHLGHAAAIDTQPSSVSEERSSRAGHVDELSAVDRRRQRRAAASGTDAADELHPHYQSRDQRQQPSDVTVTSAVRFHARYCTWRRPKSAISFRSTLRSTPPSRPNTVGLKCTSVRLSVHKKFFRF